MKYNIDLSQADSKAFFEKNGFALFKNIFTPEEIQKAREQLFAIFNKTSEFEGDWDNRPGINSLRADLFNRYPEMRWLFLKPQVQEALKKILGDDIGFVPETVAHRKGFGAWHKDTTSQERAGHLFHYEPNWMMVECAFYLQDNDKVYGGGLDVMPGTHLEGKDVYSKSKTLWTRIKNRLFKNLIKDKESEPGFHIPSKAGDFLFFNKRLIHKASPIHTTEEVPPQHEKLAIFFVGGKNNEHLMNYTNFIRTRKDYVYMVDYAYQPDFLADCAAQKIELVA